MWLDYLEIRLIQPIQLDMEEYCVRLWKDCAFYPWFINLYYVYEAEWDKSLTILPPRRARQISMSTKLGNINYLT